MNSVAEYRRRMVRVVRVGDIRPVRRSESDEAVGALPFDAVNTGDECALDPCRIRCARGRDVGEG